ncbi:MAG: UDP-N-acetylmuramoyl-tripeptide--D-alanyl-D-alanine ligase [Peptococcaceae bacterium]|jgi:UDP-N-acetylmuramoyl-tripeptide--D-alanyl-D-alanine ligase|nr:UDP-N-acetylmuramoyl-tripeptide--D-alanyl-D-alanine ligase [Peptococcaceae bacterium]
MGGWHSERIAAWMQGRHIGEPLPVARGAGMDSRKIVAGGIFFAMPGRQTDGYVYVESAWAQGASLAVVSARSFAAHPLEVPPGKALILVAEPQGALQEMARRDRESRSVRVIGVTGSSGKTTTKDMLAAVLAQSYRVYQSQGNQNNELGLPLTMLNAPEDTEILALEMGMRGLKEIAELCAIAHPETALITNIGLTHIERLGSQEAIARAKWELIEALPAQGVAILNAEDEWSVRLARQDGHRQCFYGITGNGRQPDVLGSDLRNISFAATEFTVRDHTETAQVRLPLPGRHHVLDALAALAMGKAYGVSFTRGAQALSQFQRSAMRWDVQNGCEKSILISDVYNANPDSMSASVAVLAERAQGNFTLALLGDMYELGQESRNAHFRVGRIVAQAGISCLLTVGALAADIAAGALDAGMARDRVLHCTDKTDLLAKAKNILAQHSGARVLIKASRGMRMEEVTSGLLDVAPEILEQGRMDA